MKHKSNWLLKLPFLLAAVLALILVITGCISGLAAVGWSGGTVSDGVLYVGSSGILVRIDLSSENKTYSIPLQAASQTGLFGCSPSIGGGCGAGSSGGVAIYGTPVVSGNFTYMAGYNGRVYAYDKNDISQPRWVYPTEDFLRDDNNQVVPIVGGLIVDQSRLFFGGSDGKVYALDINTHKELWHFSTGDRIWGTPAIAGDTLYIGSFDKKLYALNIADGTKKWEYATQGSIISTPLIYKDTVIFGSFDRNLYCLSVSDGTLKWQFRGGNFFWAGPVVYNDTLYVGCLDKFAYVLNPATGAEIAGFDLASPVSSTPVIVADAIIFASGKGVIYSLSTATNEIKTLADLKKTVDGPLSAYEGIIYIHTQDLELQRVNAVTGALLSPISLKSSG